MTIRSLCRFAALVCFSLICAGGSTQAHEVWVEDAEGQLFVRFAEYGDDFEKSPGALDGLGAVSAFTLSAEGKPSAVEAQKKADGFLLTGAAPAGAAYVEAAFSVMGGGDKPARKPFFYARWQSDAAAAATPALTFDLVPTGKPGEARIYFRGQPVAGAKAKLYPPAEAEQELTADAEGIVRFEVKKPGMYLLACRHHREDQKGFYGGKMYDAVSHNCSLAWRQK